jgi:hypothetical protein
MSGQFNLAQVHLPVLSATMKRPQKKTLVHLIELGRKEGNKRNWADLAQTATTNATS